MRVLRKNGLISLNRYFEGLRTFKSSIQKIQRSKHHAAKYINKVVQKQIVSKLILAFGELESRSRNRLKA